MCRTAAFNCLRVIASHPSLFQQLRWMLQRLAWREETELVALQGLLVMANPRVAVDSKSFPAAKEF